MQQDLHEIPRREEVPVAFIVQDFEWIKTMTLASGYYPALWVMNAFVANYIRLITDVGLAAPPPSDYCETWGEILNQCKAHDGEAACSIATRYFDRHDDALLDFIAPMTSRHGSQK